MSENLYVRARVSLAVSAQEAAEVAYGIVGDVSTPMLRGERIRKARRLRLIALAATDRAVLAELSEGATWDEVADALGLDTDTARRRYEPTWDQWVVGDMDDDAPLSADALAETAEMLDQWHARHADYLPPGPGPVSQVLVDGQTAPGDGQGV